VAYLYEAEFWVAVAFVVFLLLIWRAGAHRSVFAALDARRDRIKAELDEARRLKEEAQSVLTEYQRKQREAEREAEAMLAQARTEANELAAEAKARMEEFVARRTRMAEAKIAQAEQQAIADVRAAAAEAAARAAETVLSETVKGKVADELIAAAIRDVKGRIG
jgi:F-type H+-transporting ATPase subunit b